MKLNLTQKELTVWNHKSKKMFGISYNENWNTMNGLPKKEIRIALSKIHNHYYGIMNGKLTMKQIKDALGDDPIFYGKELETMRKILIK